MAALFTHRVLERQSKQSLGGGVNTPGAPGFCVSFAIVQTVITKTDKLILDPDFVLIKIILLPVCRLFCQSTSR